MDEQDGSRFIDQAVRDLQSIFWLLGVRKKLSHATSAVGSKFVVLAATCHPGPATLPK